MQILALLLTLGFTGSNESIPARDTVIIDSVPYVEWNYGVSPQAAAMILWYWDYRDYGRLVDFYFDRWDPPYGQWNYNIPNVVRELALAMYTDSMTGGTYIGNISSGISYVTNTLNGYNFQSNTSPQGGGWNNWQFSWIKNEVDNGRPCHWNVLNYWYAGLLINTSVCTIGYIIAPPDTFVIVKNPWNGLEEPWPLHTMSSSDYVVTVVPGGANPDNIFITYPTDSGIVFQYGDTVDITWDSYGSEITYVKIWLASTYDSTEWTLIDSCAPNTGVYTWIVPEESLIARINLQGFNTSNSLEAADGSFYSFITIPSGIAEQNIDNKNFFFNVSPNIFTDRLTIEFATPVTTPISLEIYDIAGRVIKTFSRSTPYTPWNAQAIPPGRPTLISWDGRNNKGQKLSSGIYFVSLKQTNKLITKKVVYLPH